MGGSMSLKLSNMRRENVLKRANLRLGGLRVITCSGITSGIDGALYMVGAMVSDDSADEVARVMCHDWKKGVVKLFIHVTNLSHGCLLVSTRSTQTIICYDRQENVASH